VSYWDTSAVVKLYVQEPDSASFEKHILGSASGPVSSRILLYEARATFQRKESEGSVRAGAAQDLYDQLVKDVSAGEWRLIELGADVEREYAQVLAPCYQQTPPIPVRTLDALHLASARVAGETELVATDRRMREAAKALGLTLFPA